MCTMMEAAHRCRSRIRVAFRRSVGLGCCGRIGLAAALACAQASQVAAMIQYADGSPLAASSGLAISGAFDSRRHAWRRQIDPARRPGDARRCDRRIRHRHTPPGASHEVFSPTALTSRAALSEAASLRTIPLRRWGQVTASAIFRLDHGVVPRPCGFPPGRGIETRRPLFPASCRRRRSCIAVISVCSAMFRYLRSGRTA